MLEFTAENLDKMIEKCSSIDNYAAGVVLSSPDRRREFVETMKEHGAQSGWRVNVKEEVVSFKNGSTIRTIKTKGGTRNRRFNEIMIDPEFPFDLVKYIYSSMLVEYTEGQNADLLEAEDTIGNFLDEFKVTE